MNETTTAMRGDASPRAATRGRRPAGWRRHCSALAAAAAAWCHAAPLFAQTAAATTVTAVAVGKRPAVPVILVVGDSLSAGYGLQRGSGWVDLLEKKLADQKVAANVVNASISGDTTSGGRSRLPALLKQHQPSVVVLELGGNDALRGLPLAGSQANLREMARASKAAGARVVIAGMEVPPNYGSRYTDEFAAIFPAVAKAEGAALVPFLLKGVADSPQAEALFQADRIHPRESAQAAMLDNVWPVLRPLLR